MIWLYLTHEGRDYAVETRPFVVQRLFFVFLIYLTHEGRDYAVETGPFVVQRLAFFAYPLLACVK